MVKHTAEDTFMEAYDAAISARQAGSHQEEIDALREALSAAYDALYPVVPSTERLTLEDLNDDRGNNP